MTSPRWCSSPGRRLIVGLSLLALACAPHHVRRRFASDFKCPVEDVRKRALAHGTWAVSGCGKQVVYSCVRGQCAAKPPPGGTALAATTYVSRSVPRADVTAPLAATPLETGRYYEGQAFRILNNEKRIVQMLDGSVWAFGGYGILLVPAEITIVEHNGQFAATMHDNRFSVFPLNGFVAWNQAQFGQVIRQMGDGSVLELTDGSLWEVSEYDRYDTDYWLPPYFVLLDDHRLLNIEEGKWVDVHRAK